MNQFASPMLDPEVVRRALHKQLSTPARIGYTLLLLTGVAAVGLIGSLWATEPGPLPTETHVAFALIVAINLSWAAFSAWVLSQRKVLYAKHRVIAGWMAVTFCTGFLLIGATVAWQRDNVNALVLIGVVGIAQLAVAGKLLQRAKRRRSALLARRDELCHELTGN